MEWRPIVVGALVGGGAAGTTTFFFMAVLGREPPTLLVPIIAVGLGMGAAHAVRIMSADPDIDEEEEPAADQTVGKVCAVCDAKIRLTLDATECEDCGGVFHEHCFDDHDCA